MPSQSAPRIVRPVLAVGALCLTAMLGFLLLLWPEGAAGGPSSYGRWLLGRYTVPLDVPLLLIGLPLAAPTYLFSSIALVGLSGSPLEGCLRRLPAAVIATGFVLAILGFAGAVAADPTLAGPSLHDSGVAAGILGVLFAAVGFLVGLSPGRDGNDRLSRLGVGRSA